MMANKKLPQISMMENNLMTEKNKSNTDQTVASESKDLEFSSCLITRMTSGINIQAGNATDYNLKGNQTLVQRTHAIGNISPNPNSNSKQVGPVKLPQHRLVQGWLPQLPAPPSLSFSLSCTCSRHS